MSCGYGGRGRRRRRSSRCPSRRAPTPCGRGRRNASHGAVRRGRRAVSVHAARCMPMEGTPLAVGDAGQVTPCVIKALMADDTFCMYFVGNIELLSSQITDYAINSKLTEGLSLCNLLKQLVTSESAGISNESSGRLFISNCRRGCKSG